MTTSKKVVVGWWGYRLLTQEPVHLFRDAHALGWAYCGKRLPAGAELVLLNARPVCPVCSGMLHHLMFDHGGLTLRVPASDGVGVQEVELGIDEGEQPAVAPSAVPVDMAAVNLYDLGSLLHCAIGYALGRQTYMTAVVQKLVRTHWSDLLDADRETLTTNLRRDLDAYERHHRLAGDMNDHANWRGLLKWCQEQEATGS